MKSGLQPGVMGTSIAAFGKSFPDSNACAEYMLAVRLNGCCCPECGRSGDWRIFKNGRAFRHTCGRYISTTSHTVFHSTQLNLYEIFYSMLLFSNFRSGVPTSFLERHIGLSYKAAYGLGQRIRQQMQLLDRGRQVGGVGQFVEIGETALKHVRISGRRGPVKISILSLGDARHVVSRVIARRRRRFMTPLINELVRPGSILLTRDPKVVAHLTEYGRIRADVCFIKEKTPDIQNIDVLGSYWKQLKRILNNMYSHQGINNLPLYIGEFEFRFNRRAASQNIFWDLISRFPDRATKQADY